MKKMTSATFSLMFAGAALATACILVPSVVLPMVTVPAMASPQARTDAIANHISQFLGSASSSEIMVLRIPTQTCLLGVCGATLNVAFYKPCGEDAAEAFRQIQREGVGSGSGSGGADGGNTGPGWGNGGNGGGAGWGGGSPCPRGCVSVGNVHPT